MKVLFDGKSLDAWRGYKSDAVPQGWRIENGALTPPQLVPRAESRTFKERYGQA